MTKELQSIPLTEFSSNPTSFVEEVIRESKPILVENDNYESRNRSIRPAVEL